MAVSGTTAKEGVKTSEFWVTVITKVVGLGVISYGMWKQNDGALALGGIIVGVASGTYSLSRGLAKKDNLNVVAK